MNKEKLRVCESLSTQAQFFHDAFAHWLADPGVTIVCGRWGDGAISELVPRRRARLPSAMYDGCFTGVRELRLTDPPHHLHIDFGRVHAPTHDPDAAACFLNRSRIGAPSSRSRKVWNSHRSSMPTV